MQLSVAETQDPRAQRSRAAIVRAASELLATGGLDAATVQAISDRAGVHKTTVYRHWPDATDLVFEALEGLLEGAAPPNTGDVRTDLERMAIGLTNSLQRDPWRTLIPSIVGAGACRPRFAELYGQFVRERRQAARVIVTRAISRGQLAADIDPDLMIESVAGPVYYRTLLTRERITRNYARMIVDRALSSAWSGC